MEKHHKSWLSAGGGENTTTLDSLVFLASAMVYIEKLEDEGQQSMVGVS